MTGVRTDKGRINCEVFINCAGQVSHNVPHIINIVNFEGSNHFLRTTIVIIHVPERDMTL